MNSLLPSTNLTALTSEALTSRLGQLLGDERALLVDFLHHLAEMDRRRLCLDLGYSSLFTYLTEHLRLSKASAFRRITAVRLLSRFPGVADLLADGRLCLTTLCSLKDVLAEENAAKILERAAGRTEEEVQVLVASLRPKPALPDFIRALPARKVTGDKLVQSEALNRVPIGSGPEPAATLEPATAEGRRQSQLAVGTSPRRTQVTPLSGDLQVIRMTVGTQFIAELDEVKSALSHRVPQGSLEALLRECFRITLEACSRRQRGAGTNKRRDVAEVSEPAAQTQRAELVRTPEPPAGLAQVAIPESVPEVIRNAGSRYLPVAVRREVWERDEGRCAFVGSSGKRCNSRHRLEFHHRKPFAAGGEATAGNLSLRCHQHNQFEARLDFGDELMDCFSRGMPQRRQAIDSPQCGLITGS